MANEPQDLAKEDGAWWSDIVDLVFGAGMIVAGLAVIVMMILMTVFSKADWYVWPIGIIVFVFSCAVGGMMAKEAWRNLRKRIQRG